MTAAVTSPEAGARADGHGAYVWPILRLGAPLIAFFGMQTLASLACLALLGRLGDAVLAGIGTAGAIYGVVLALMFGVDTGVQAIVSRVTGAQRADRLGGVLSDALALSVPLGGALAALTWAQGPALLGLILRDPATVAAGGGYLRALAPSLLFLALTIPVNACWIGSGRPALAFLVTAATSLIQVPLTLLLVFGWGPVPALGAAGGGVSGSITALIAVGLQYGLVFQGPRIAQFPRRPQFAGAAAIAALGWPVSLQQAVFQLGLMAAFVILAQIGVAATAAANVLVQLSTLPIQIGVGLGVAAATLVGQSLGRGAPDAARAWGWRTALLAAGVTAPMGLVALLAPHHLLGLFLHQPATLELAVGPARILGATMGFDAVARVLSFAARGAGATKIASAVPFVLQWPILLPLTWWVALSLGLGLAGVVGVQAAVAMVEAGLFAWIWSGRTWTRVRVGG